MEGVLSMDIKLRHTPSFGVARLMLGADEHVKVEAGAMYAMSAGVALDSKMDGGFMKAAKRAMLGGESFFISNYTAPAQGGFVDVGAFGGGGFGAKWTGGQVVGGVGMAVVVEGNECREFLLGR